MTHALLALTLLLAMSSHGAIFTSVAAEQTGSTRQSGAKNRDVYVSVVKTETRARC